MRQGSNIRHLCATLWIFLPKGLKIICWSRFHRLLWGLKTKGDLWKVEQCDLSCICWQCQHVLYWFEISIHEAFWWFPPASFGARMQSASAGFMRNTPHSPGLSHKVWELFIEYLAHSSFKDFTPANCFYWGINYEFHSSKYCVCARFAWVQVFNQPLACHKWSVGPASGVGTMPPSRSTLTARWSLLFRFNAFWICLSIFCSFFFLQHHVLQYGLQIRDLTGYSVKGCVNTDFYPKLFTLCSFIHSFIHSLSTLSDWAGTGC